MPYADWPRPDLTDRLLRALAVAGKVVEAFASSGYDEPDEAEVGFPADKAVAETAMLLHAAAPAAADPRIGAPVAAIAAALAGAARTEVVLLRAALHPSIAEGLSVPHVLLSRLGYPDPAADIILAACAAAPAAMARELPPYGTLEKLWIRELWGRPVPASAWHQTMGASGLATTPDAVGGTREDSYAFTHALMYVTDFGSRADRLPRPAPALLGDARTLLAVCVDSGDYDQAGELLMAWPFLGAPWSAAASFAFGVLAMVEDRAGLLPGGTTNAERLRGMDGERRRRYALGTAYHTAYVMGMLCAVSLRPGRAPSASPGGVADEEPVPVGVVRHIMVDQPDVVAALARLSEQELEAVAPFLLDVTVAQAIRTQAYGRLADLLRAVSASGWPGTELTRQAAALLGRVALVAATPRQPIAEGAAAAPVEGPAAAPVPAT